MHDTQRLLSTPPGNKDQRVQKGTTAVSGSHSIQPVIVVSHKGVEGPQLHPSDTQLLRGVAAKAADVRPRQWHPEQAKLQHGWGEETIRYPQTIGVENTLSEELVPYPGWKSAAAPSRSGRLRSTLRRNVQYREKKIGTRRRASCL